MEYRFNAEEWDRLSVADRFTAVGLWRSKHASFPKEMSHSA